MKTCLIWILMHFDRKKLFVETCSKNRFANFSEFVRIYDMDFIVYVNKRSSKKKFSAQASIHFNIYSSIAEYRWHKQ